MLRLRPRALNDIRRIALRIAKDNPTAALRWSTDIRARCRNVAMMPGIGSPRDDVAPGLRVLVVGNYLILYREFEGGADVLRIIHGARRWETMI